VLRPQPASPIVNEPARATACPRPGFLVAEPLPPSCGSFSGGNASMAAASTLVSTTSLTLMPFAIKIISLEGVFYAWIETAVRLAIAMF
jgi:hypothetical protein